jgi:cell division protein ZapD
LVFYEYPFNESVRTQLRLERLFERLALLVAREEAVDHHFALATLFEVMDVAARADVKSDLLKELDRHRALLLSYRGNPNISETALEDVLHRIDVAFTELNQASGKTGQALMGNDWLMGIRSRINIPGGTCEFDLPAYFAWQQYPPKRRQTDLKRWMEALKPLAQALELLLGLLRDAGTPHKVSCTGGQFQQSLPTGRAYQLLRLRLASSLELVPEISGHRLMVSVRLMRMDVEGRLRPYTGDAQFEIALCS